MFKLDDDILQQLRATFKEEAAEHIQAMNRVLLALEKNPEGEERAALVEEIFREAHSLKGAAGAADLPEVEATAHKLENVLGAARNGSIKLTRENCDLLYEGVDAVNAIVHAALEGKPHGLELPQLYARLDAAEKGAVSQSPKPSPSLDRVENDRVTAVAPAQVTQPGKALKVEEAGKPTSHHPVAEDSIRVSTKKIDKLMTQAGELLVAGLRIDQRLHEVNELSHAAEEWNREWFEARAANSALFHDHARNEYYPLLKLLDTNQERLRMLLNQVNDLQRSLAPDVLHLSRVTNDLGESVMQVRMLPVSTLFDTFPRLVRDAARECGKEVELVMAGAETELDRQVLEEIKASLIHLLRNAVDHGLESPDERVRLGKPRGGIVTLNVSQKGNSIIILVSDDGAGINSRKVKEQAVRAGLVSAADAQTMSDDQALRLIFAAGLSTKTTVTGLSGRGVGMDVVKKNVDALQGQIDVESTQGKGTTITLVLPLTLATTQQLLVSVSDQTFGIPISAVERIQRIYSQDIHSVQGTPAISVDHEPVSLARLSSILKLVEGEPKISEDGKLPVVILISGKKRIGILVDAVVGQQETVVKSLGKQLARVRNVAGATILGTGQVILALNPSDLMKSARGIQAKPVVAQRAAPTPVQESKRRTVLVVDDSMSTRTLEKSILETAGYNVMAATDGYEAIGMLNSKTECDIVVSDIMMPRMTGLELTSAIKNDPRLKQIRVVLVTSLDSRADKEKGIEVGADAYIVKSDFDQSNLLQTIAQLV